MNDFNATLQSYFKGLPALVIKLIVKPGDFFRTMPKDGGFLEPLIFVVLTTLLGVLLNAVELFVSRGVGLAMVAAWMIIVPMIAIILSFFFAGILYAVWSFMGSRENYETSYRCLAYMQIFFPILILLSVVPYLALFGIGWWLYLMVIAAREVHKVPARPALVVFGAVAALSGLVYYNSVSSTLEAKQHLKDYTKELQRMPGASDMGNSRKH